jgi:hypothetical protein
MELNTYRFRRIRTYRSVTAFIETEGRSINVKAKDRDAAEAKVAKRKDARVRCENGDILSWRMMVFPA